MSNSAIELKTHPEEQLSPSSMALQSLTNDSVVLLKPNPESSHNNKKDVLIKLRNVVILALIFMTLEIIGGVLADSIAILSDAAHMLSDLLSFAISIISVYISTFPPNSRNSFGYHRAGVVGALASVVLIWVLTGFLVYYAVDRIFSIDQVQLDAKIMMVTSIIGLGMNLVMVKVLHGSGGHSHCSHSHSHSHSHSRAHSHTHTENIECSHDHSDHHHHHPHSNETHQQKYSPPSHGEEHAHHHGKHNHESHKHSQFSHQHKHETCDHGHNPHNPHKHSKKPPTLKISPNKRYGRGEFDSPVQRLITSPLEALTKSSPNDKADLSTEKTDTTLTDQNNTSSHSHQEIAPHHHHSHQEHHHDHHHHDHGHDHGHDHHHHEEDLNIRAAMIHIIGDILQSIGVIIASIVILFNPDKFKIIDPILTILFSVIVLFTTKRILADCLNVIMQSTPAHVDADEIKALIENVPNVKSVHNLHIWSLTVGKPVLSAHVFAEGDLAQTLSKITKVCRKEGIKHTTIQIEHIHDEENENFINCDHDVC